MTDKLREAAQQALDVLDNMTDSQSNPARRNFPTIHDYGKSRRAADALRAALAQQDAQAVPPGYKLVPVKVTEEMEKAWWTNFGDVHALWAAMLNAAPTPPAQRVMLTDDEIDEVWNSIAGHSIYAEYQIEIASAMIEAYERKSRIK